MTKREQEYKRQVKLLKQRISRLEAKGYTFDKEALLKGSEKNMYYASQYFESLRGQRLIDLAKPDTPTGDFSSFMNEPEFVPPPDSIAPETYSAIDRIRDMLSDFPDIIYNVQFDEGNWGSKDKRDTVLKTSLGRVLRDVFEKNVQEATQDGWLMELDAYYEDMESQLADLIQPFKELVSYRNESDLRTSHTQALRLLNVGEALSMEEMTSYSDYYTNLDNYEE